MKTIAAVFITLFAISVAAQAQSPETRKKEFNLEKGLAIQGYDPVAYFTQSKAVKGQASNAFTYKNATYRFATAANRDAFQKSPEKFEPQYGGWCAYALGATGEKVEIDPETFKIVDGKLFLFYHTFINNTLSKWNKDQANLHKKADASWIKFVPGNS